MESKTVFSLVKTILVLLVFFTQVSYAATENEIITKVKKSARIYIVRSNDSKLFLLLDKTAIGLDEKKAVNSIKSYLKLGTDALCLEGDFGNGNIFTIYPIVKKNIYFISPIEGQKTTMKLISETLMLADVNINLDVLNKYMKK